MPQEPGEECARIFSGEAFNRDRDRYRIRFRDVLSIKPFDFEPDRDSDSESCQNQFLPLPQGLREFSIEFIHSALYLHPAGRIRDLMNRVKKGLVLTSQVI